MISKVPSTRNKHNMLYIPQNTLFCPTTGLRRGSWGNRVGLDKDGDLGGLGGGGGSGYWMVTGGT